MLRSLSKPSSHLKKKIYINLIYRRDACVDFLCLRQDGSLSAEAGGGWCGRVEADLLEVIRGKVTDDDAAAWLPPPPPPLWRLPSLRPPARLPRSTPPPPRPETPKFCWRMTWCEWGPAPWPVIWVIKFSGEGYKININIRESLIWKFLELSKFDNSLSE